MERKSADRRPTIDVVTSAAMNSREQKGPSTPELLLEETIRAIEEGGEASVRVKSVAEAVGVAATSIYHFFGSREDLIDSANSERYLRTLYGPNWGTLLTAVTACESKDEFREIVRAILKVGNDAEGQARRRTRVSVLGSAVSRPSLAAKVREANLTYAREAAYSFSKAQVRGWIRRDIDLEAFSMWNIGQMTGRYLVELDDPIGDLDAWEQIELDAVLSALLGEAPPESAF